MKCISRSKLQFLVAMLIVTTLAYGATPSDAFAVTTVSTTFRSVASLDGMVLESGEFTGAGGIMDATSFTFNLGDDASNRQYRAILSFPTASLPDNAVITAVSLKIRSAAFVGSNPFGTMGSIKGDVKKGAFSGASALQLTDFQALATRNAAITIGNIPSSGWYSGPMNSAYFGTINKAGVTQIRLRFAVDDNNNRVANYIKFYSGNSVTTVDSRPALIVRYYVPTVPSVFEEHFTDGEISNSPTWTVNNSAYSIVSGVLHSDGKIIDESDRYINGFSSVVSIAASDYLNISYRGQLESVGSPQTGRGIQLALGNNTSGNSYMLNIQNGYTNGFPTNKYCISITFGNGNLFDVVTSATAPNYDQWYYVQAIRSAGIWKLYVNGALIGQAPTMGPLTQIDTVQLWTVGSVAVDDIIVRTTP